MLSIFYCLLEVYIIQGNGSVVSSDIHSCSFLQGSAVAELGCGGKF